MRRRPLQILETLESTNASGIFFTDADAVWNRDPLTIVDRRQFDACDVVTTEQNNGKARKYNPGVMFARNNKRVHDLMRTWAEKFVADSVNLVKFNQAIMIQQAKNAIVVCGIVSKADILDGKNFKKGRTVPEPLLKNAALVHVNWTPKGLDEKVSTLERLGLWRGAPPAET